MQILRPRSHALTNPGSAPADEPEQKQIVILGPRNAGKTTYLATLLHGEKASLGAEIWKVVDTFGDAPELQAMAKDLLCQGRSLERTERAGAPEKKNYGLYLEVRTRPKAPPQTITLLCEDYPGEIFEDLQNPGAANNDANFSQFMDDCLGDWVQGCLVLLGAYPGDLVPGNHLDYRDWDEFYRQCFAGFLDEADRRGRVETLRLAVALSKCERGEVWTSRLDPEFDIFQQRFPQTHRLLREKWPTPNLTFYALSTFGVLDAIKDPRPNRITAPNRSETLRNSHDVKGQQPWRPYGLVSPLYWLHTGQRMRSDV